MRIVHFLLGALFILFATLQFNDPDPLYWVAVYSGTALVTLGKGLGRSSEFFTAVMIGAVAAGMMITTPGFADYVSSGNFNSIFGDMREFEYVEPTREFLGLSLALSLLLYYARR